jgi:hypothetical protein
VVAFDNYYTIHLINKFSGDTLDVGYPNKFTGQYSFIVSTGAFKLVYSGPGYLSLSIDTTIIQDNPASAIVLDVILERDTAFVFKAPPADTVEITPVIYDKINLENIPIVSAIDSSILIRNMKVNDLNDINVKDSDVLYYTIQVMALYNPVDVSYFKRISDMKVMYAENDRFYRYTSGRFATREEAAAWRLELIRKGYPDQIFIKKVSK